MSRINHRVHRLSLLCLPAFLLAALPCAAQTQQNWSTANFLTRDQAWSYSCPQSAFRPDLGDSEALAQPNATGQYQADYPGETYPGERRDEAARDGNFNISGDWYRSTPSKQEQDEQFAPDPLMALTTDRLAAIYGPADVTTMLVDGQYKLGSSTPQNPRIQPFVTGGLGLAVLEQSLYSAGPGIPDHSYMPMYQVGGGLSYALEGNLGLSLSYRASFAQDTGGNFMLTNHDPSQIDTQIIDLGLNYKF